MAREIWKMYVRKGYEDMLIARALALEDLTEDEVGQELIRTAGTGNPYWQNGRSD